MSTTSQNGLTGQRALVTGATSGMGRAVGVQLARDGAEVLVHGRDAARGAETVEEITAAGGKASFVAADLGDAADVQRLAGDVGDVDILINRSEEHTSELQSLRHLVCRLSLEKKDLDHSHAHRV